MVLEIADIRIQSGQNAAFEEAIQRGLQTVVSQAHGYQGHSVHRCVETVDRYVLQIRWESVEAHNVGFRQSELFTQWRAIVGPFFAGPPNVEHFTLVTTSS